MRSCQRYLTDLLLVPWQCAGRTTRNQCLPSNFCYHCLRIVRLESILCQHLSCDSTPNEGGVTEFSFPCTFFVEESHKLSTKNYVSGRHFFGFIWKLCCFTTGFHIIYTRSICFYQQDLSNVTLLREYLVSVDGRVFIWRMVRGC